MANTCDLQSEDSSIPHVVDVNSVVQESCVYNNARNKKQSFRLPVTLWVYGKKAQAEALVDSGATTNFIDKKFVLSNNLVMNKLATPYDVRNADGTFNVDGRITHYVRAYIEIGSHKTTQMFFVTELGAKAVMLGYTFLHHHNPEIDWKAGEWKFTRCPDTCADRARKKRSTIEEEIDDLQLDQDTPWNSALDDLGTEDQANPYINWVDLDRPEHQKQANVIATLIADQDEFEEDEDTSKWKSLVPEWVHMYGDVFSKRKSERMPTRKPYDHAIEIEEGAKLPRLAKSYNLAPSEMNSLDEWIREELRKGYI